MATAGMYQYWSQQQQQQWYAYQVMLIVHHTLLATGMHTDKVPGYLAKYATCNE